MVEPVPVCEVLKIQHFRTSVALLQIFDSAKVVVARPFFTKIGEEPDRPEYTPEHYLPLIYTLALRDKNDTVSLFNDKPVGGSLTMTSVKIDPH